MIKQFHKCLSKNPDLQITHIHLKSLRKTLFFTVQILQISNRNHFHNNVIKTLQRRPSPHIRALSLFWHKEQNSIKEFCSNLPVALVKQEAMMGKMFRGCPGQNKKVPKTKGSHTGRTKARPLSLHMKSYTTKERRNRQINPPKDIRLIHPKCIQFLVMGEMNPLQKMHDQTPTLSKNWCLF